MFFGYVLFVLLCMLRILVYENKNVLFLARLSAGKLKYGTVSELSSVPNCSTKAPSSGLFLSNGVIRTASRECMDGSSSK